MKKSKKILLLILTAILLFGGLYAMTFIPKKIITIESENVSKIEIFDGNRGEQIVVTNDDQIEQIISNLNTVTFKKGNLSIGYMGYKFDMTIYDDNGKEYKKLIINSNDQIRYRGFFHTAETGEIDYDYIDELF